MPADFIKLNFDSTLRPRIVNGLCRAGKYQDEVVDTTPVPGVPGPPPYRLIPNPETRAQFAQRYAAELLMNAVVAAEEADDRAAVPRRVKPPIT